VALSATADGDLRSVDAHVGQRLVDALPPPVLQFGGGLNLFPVGEQLLQVGLELGQVGRVAAEVPAAQAGELVRAGLPACLGVGRLGADPERDRDLPDTHPGVLVSQLPADIVQHSVALVVELVGADPVDRGPDPFLGQRRRDAGTGRRDDPGRPGQGRGRRDEMGGRPDRASRLGDRRRADRRRDLLVLQAVAGRRDRIRKVAGEIGTHLLENYGTAAAGVYQARLQLRACMVPRPGRRTPASAILRELALSPESLSAAQLAELLDPALRPSVADLRAFLRAHDKTMFEQVRWGGFVLGSHYELPG